MTAKDKYYIRVKNTLVEVTHEVIWSFTALDGKNVTSRKRRNVTM